MTGDESYLRESILNPQAKVVTGFGPIMPAFQGQISERAIVASGGVLEVAVDCEAGRPDGQTAAGIDAAKCEADDSPNEMRKPLSDRISTG